MAEQKHSEFAFSASPRWMPCAASMAHKENLQQDRDGGVYADEGTAAHTLASWCLTRGHKAEKYIGQKIKAGKREFEVTEEFADYVQAYVDDVDRRSLGAHRMIEVKVTLADIEGFDESNFGTSDVIIGVPARKGLPAPAERYAYGVVEDLKFGRGERVYAWTRATDESLFTFDIYDEDSSLTVEPNFQLMLYALASLKDIRMLVDDPTHVLLVIHQPRLDHISELRVPIAVLERFAVFAAERYARGLAAQKKLKAEYYNPGEKQCRWCLTPSCKARAAKVMEEASADFDTIDGTPVVTGVTDLEKAFKALPFIEDWCKAVAAEVAKQVAAGIQLKGPDGKPLKFVEGKQGDRKWINATEAEAALVGQLADLAYDKKILSVAVAEKKFKKKPAIWKDVFLPLFKRAPGKPQLALGSDNRPPYEVASSEGEFEDTDDGRD